MSYVEGFSCFIDEGNVDEEEVWVYFIEDDVFYWGFSCFVGFVVGGEGVGSYWGYFYEDE